MSGHTVGHGPGLLARGPVRRRDRVEWWLLGPAIAFGGVGAVVGLIVGLVTYWKTAPFAALELGIPSALLGGTLGVIAFASHAAIKYIGRRS